MENGEASYRLSSERFKIICRRMRAVGACAALLAAMLPSSSGQEK